MADIDFLAEANFMRSNVLDRPEHLLQRGSNLVSMFGVTANYMNDGASYIEQVRSIDPRYRNSKGEERSISRQDVATKAHTMTDDLLVGHVMSTAEDLGILTPAYPFDTFAKSAEVVLVTGGVLNALRSRTIFAKNAGIPVVKLVGSDRAVQAGELKQLESEGKDPSTFKTELDLANLVAEEQNIDVFAPRTTSPDNLDVIKEFVLTNLIENIAVVTTPLYVPFATTDIGTVLSAFKGEVKAQVYAGESDPQIVAKRTVDVYRSEIARTLVGAQRWYAENKRRQAN